MSFAAIQDSQKQAQPVKDVRSFREIQEEEQSLQIEADFLKWWTAEEERIKHEALHLAKPPHRRGRNRRKGAGTVATIGINVESTAEVHSSGMSELIRQGSSQNLSKRRG